MCCGLAEVVDGNVLSRSHEELQLVNKTGSANDCMSMCVFVGEFFLSLPFTTLWKGSLYLNALAFAGAFVYECHLKCVSGSA